MDIFSYILVFSKESRKIQLDSRLNIRITASNTMFGTSDRKY